MPGLFGNQQNMGLLGAYQQQQTPGWANTLGILSAGLKDAANSVQGSGTTDNLQNWQQSQRSQVLQRQLMDGLQSQDPSIRQQAYQVGALLGMDTKPFQQMQAQQALPQLLRSMQPSQQTLNSQSAPLPGGGNITTAPINFQAPGMNISDALSASNSPELQGIYGPKVLDAQFTQEAEANKPYELSAGQHRFVGGQDIASLPEKNNPNQPFNAADGTPNLAYQKWRQADQVAGRAPMQHWQILTDPKTSTQYRYDVDSGKALTLGGQPYTPTGAEKISGGTARSPGMLYMQKFISEHPGASADEINKQAKAFRMGQSEAGTVGTRAGAADVSALEVSAFAKQAIDASNNLPRADWELTNSALQSWDMKTSNPKLRRLMIAADAVVNARARAISPTGSPHVNDQLEGRKMLSAAFANGDFAEAVDQMQQEADGVLTSTRAAKDAVLGGDKGPPGAPQSLPRLPGAKKPTVSNW
jgi:hypothetical protein